VLLPSFFVAFQSGAGGRWCSCIFFAFCIANSFSVSVFPYSLPVIFWYAEAAAELTVSLMSENFDLLSSSLRPGSVYNNKKKKSLVLEHDDESSSSEVLNNNTVEGLLCCAHGIVRMKHIGMNERKRENWMPHVLQNNARRKTTTEYKKHAQTQQRLLTHLCGVPDLFVLAHSKHYYCFMSSSNI